MRRSANKTRLARARAHSLKVEISFAMFETVGYDTKSKSLNFWLCLFRSASIGENPRQIDDFCNPMADFTRKFMGRCYDFPQDSEKDQSRCADPGDLNRLS